MGIIDNSALIEVGANLGDNISIWQYSHIREGSDIGSGSIIGRGVYIGPGVKIGKNCKIQNYALLYEPAEISDGVFLGPAVVLTNDKNPRAINPDMTIKNESNWEKVGVKIMHGASVGARSICVAPLQIGTWAMVAAGSVVVNDVPNFALVAGVPARQIGWVGKLGFPLQKTLDVTVFECPQSNSKYKLADGKLSEI